MTRALSKMEAAAVELGLDAATHSYNMVVLWADTQIDEAKEMSPRDVIDMVSAMVAMPGLERLNHGEADPSTSAITITIAINPYE